jgi:hypothetical protein
MTNRAEFTFPTSISWMKPSPTTNFPVLLRLIPILERPSQLTLGTINNTTMLLFLQEQLIPSISCTFKAGLSETFPKDSESYQRGLNSASGSELNSTMKSSPKWESISTSEDSATSKSTTKAELFATTGLISSS